MVLAEELGKLIWCCQFDFVQDWKLGLMLAFIVSDLDQSMMIRCLWMRYIPLSFFIQMLSLLDLKSINMYLVCDLAACMILLI